MKNYFKKPLQTIGLYGQTRHLFFLFLERKVAIANLFYKKFCHTAPILLYHRITSPREDPLMLCVTPKCFEEHLKFLGKNYDIIPLSALSGRLVSGTLEGNEASITFDDGYRDNLTNALPLLEKYKIPATIFITTGNIGGKANFAWDKKYSENDRAFFLNEAEIKLLSNHPLIDIGAHTETHPNLIQLSPTKQMEEITKSRQKLEKITGKKINSFAYPFGGFYNFDSLTKKIIAKVGFGFAYSNTQELATKTKDHFSLPRINIRNYNINILARKIVCQIKKF